MPNISEWCVVLKQCFHFICTLMLSKLPALSSAWQFVRWINKCSFMKMDPCRFVKRQLQILNHPSQTQLLFIFLALLKRSPSFHYYCMASWPLLLIKTALHYLQTGNNLRNTVLQDWESFVKKKKLQLNYELVFYFLQRVPLGLFMQCWWRHVWVPVCLRTKVKTTDSETQLRVWFVLSRHACMI